MASLSGVLAKETPKGPASLEKCAWRGSPAQTLTTGGTALPTGMVARQAHRGPAETIVLGELLPHHRNQCGKETFFYVIYAKIPFIMPLLCFLNLSGSLVP